MAQRRWRVVILAAVAEEGGAVKIQFTPWTQTVLRNGRLVNTFQGRVVDAELEVILCTLYEMGAVAAALATTVLLEELQPDILISTGVCGGHPELCIGDVVVASSTVTISAGKMTADGLLQESRVDSIANNLLGYVGELGTTLTYALPGTNPVLVPRKFGVILGPIGCSDNHVVANLTKDKWRELRSAVAQRKLAAVEMEGNGIYMAASHWNDSNQSGQRMLFMMVKGVMDNANTEKNDGAKVIAAENAAFFARRFIETYTPLLANTFLRSPLQGRATGLPASRPETPVLLANLPEAERNALFTRLAAQVGPQWPILAGYMGIGAGTVTAELPFGLPPILQAQMFFELAARRGISLAQLEQGLREANFVVQADNLRRSSSLM